MSRPAHRPAPTYRPDFADYFPRRRNGHGSGIGWRKRRKVQSCLVCRTGDCVDARGENIDDWRQAHGLPMSSKRELRRKIEREGKPERPTPYRGPSAVLAWSA